MLSHSKVSIPKFLMLAPIHTNIPCSSHSVRFPNQHFECLSPYALQSLLISFPTYPTSTMWRVQVVYVVYNHHHHPLTLLLGWVTSWQRLLHFSLSSYKHYLISMPILLLISLHLPSLGLSALLMVSPFMVYHHLNVLYIQKNCSSHHCILISRLFL